MCNGVNNCLEDSEGNITRIVFCVFSVFCISVCFCKEHVQAVKTNLHPIQ